MTHYQLFDNEDFPVYPVSYPGILTPNQISSSEATVEIIGRCTAADPGATITLLRSINGITAPSTYVPSQEILVFPNEPIYCKTKVINRFFMLRTNASIYGLTLYISCVSEKI